MNLQELERITYINGHPGHPFVVDLIDAEAENEAMQAEIDKLTTASSTTDECQPALDLIPAQALINELTNQLASLTAALDQVCTATGQARASKLKTSLTKPLKRAVRARINAHDALQDFNLFFLTTHPKTQ